MRKLILAAAAVLLAVPAAAQQPPPPKLLVVISVDQFSADLFDEYRSQFTGGLARLAQGTVFDKAYQSHATTETCPGHSTILTGDHPSRTGIIANSWIDQLLTRADKSVYCAEDESVPASQDEAYRVSAKQLRVPTLGELMKARWPESRDVSVAGKDRAAAMMGGRSADLLAYWDGKQFEIRSQNAGAVPASVVQVNQAVRAQIASAQPPLEPPPFCAARAQSVAIAGHASVGAGAFARAAGDAKAYEASPEADGAVLALAAGLIRDLGLGRRGSADLIAIGLSATDYVGHEYGPGGQEMCLQLLSLDRDIGDFLGRLDSWGIDYAVALTADHGGQDIPERLRLHGVSDAARIDPSLTPKAIGELVAKQTGLAEPILVNAGVIGDLYLDAHLQGADRQRALYAVLAAYRAHPQVAAAFSRAEIAGTPVPTGDPTRWSLIQRVRASFDGQRSGDLYVVLKPHITPIGHAAGSVATHGSPWDYDRRVPILFWRPGFRGATVNAPVDTVDIMPTLATLIGLPLAPGSVDGHCLEGTPAFCQ